MYQSLQANYEKDSALSTFWPLFLEEEEALFCDFPSSIQVEEAGALEHRLASPGPLWSGLQSPDGVE